MEFTGLKFQYAADSFDTFYERYLKAITAANNFQIIQVGICIFIKKGDLEYDTYPFNFYVFPPLQRGVDTQFKCQTESFYFLKMYDMDFNKWIKEGTLSLTMQSSSLPALGVPYLNKSMREELEKKLADEVNFDAGGLGYQAPWLKKKLGALESEIKQWQQHGFKDPLVIEGTQLRMKLPLLKFLRSEFPEIQYSITQKEEWVIYNKFDITLSTMEMGLQKQMSVESRAKEEVDAILDQAMGFTKIWYLLKKYQVTLVGHNCFLDLLFMFSHFEEELGPNFEEFLHRVKGFK